MASDPSEVAIVVCLRHAATAFAFTDAIWSKSGASLPARPEDQRGDDEERFDNSPDRRDEAFDALIKLGVHFAVCDKSTQGLAAKPRAQNGRKVRRGLPGDCSRT